MSRWTRADYEAVSRVICHRAIEHDTNPEPVTEESYRTALRDLAIDLAHMYEADNPNFNVTRFMEACDFELERVAGKKRKVWV